MRSRGQDLKQHAPSFRMQPSTLPLSSEKALPLFSTNPSLAHHLAKQYSILTGKSRHPALVILELAVQLISEATCGYAHSGLSRNAFPPGYHDISNNNLRAELSQHTVPSSTRSPPRPARPWAFKAEVNVNGSDITASTWQKLYLGDVKKRTRSRSRYQVQNSKCFVDHQR